jgi:mitochondrial chaperone BCS1
MLTAGTQAMGVGATILRQGAKQGAVALQRRMLVTLEMTNKDIAYEWFLAWMAHQSKQTGQNRAASWVKSHNLSVETAFEQRKNGSSSAAFRLVAGPGNHYFKYRGAWMQVRARDPGFLMHHLIHNPRLGETATRNALSTSRHRETLGNSDPHHPLSRSKPLQ